MNICLEGCSLDAIPSVIMHDNDKINTEDTYAGTRDGLEWVCWMNSDGSTTYYAKSMIDDSLSLERMARTHCASKGTAWDLRRKLCMTMTKRVKGNQHEPSLQPPWREAVTTSNCSGLLNTRTIPGECAVGCLGWFPVRVPLPVTVSFREPFWISDSVHTFEVCDSGNSDVIKNNNLSCLFHTLLFPIPMNHHTFWPTSSESNQKFCWTQQWILALHSSVSKPVRSRTHACWTAGTRGKWTQCKRRKTPSSDGDWYSIMVTVRRADDTTQKQSNSLHHDMFMLRTSRHTKGTWSIHHSHSWNLWEG